MLTPPLATLLSPEGENCESFTAFSWPALASGDYDIPEYTPISNQGPIGTCVANSVADGLEIVCGVRDPNSVVQVSRLDLYWGSRASHDATDVDKGTYISAALKKAKNVGVCAESVWPYVVSKVNTPPPIEATIRASENKINGFYAIKEVGFDRSRAVCDALYANFPVVFATGVANSFSGIGSHTDSIKPPSRASGYHAMVIVGVRVKNGRHIFKVRNSWGTGWGNSGYWWMDEDYLLWSETKDIWALTHMDPLM